ncbi:MAG: hypothetical protein GH155_06460 [Spirochaeta sp.]|nr:hypothetical protein [Spirochaeta sp.]
MKSIYRHLLSGLILFAAGIALPAQAEATARDYKQLMREFVQKISRYARGCDPDFIVIPQNGCELLTANGRSGGAASLDYLGAISGIGQEDLFYGYKRENTATSKKESEYLLNLLYTARANDIHVLVIDYCRHHRKVDDSYRKNSEQGFISFAAPTRELKTIPDYPSPVFNENSLDIKELSEARNFLYLLNPEEFESKNNFLASLGETNYDCLIIDAFFDDGSGGSRWLKSRDVALLKTKKNGGSRLVIAYMSIGEAETYRYYWHESWDKNGDGRADPAAPEWLTEENPDWEGNYKVRYWHPGWQSIIYGNDDSYLKNIIDRGFDGVYLDIIDAFDYFEE